MAEIDEFKTALRKLPPRPWNATIVPPSQFQRQGFTIKPGDDDIGPQGGFEVGTIRSVTGANVVEPWPESASMVIAIPGVLEALAQVMSTVDGIIELYEQQISDLEAQVLELTGQATTGTLETATVEDVTVSRRPRGQSATN